MTTSGPAVRLVAGLLRPHRRRIALAVALAAVQCLLTLPAPLLMQRLVDGTAGRAAIPAAALLLAAAVVAQAACGFAAAVVTGGIALDVACDLRRRVYARLLAADPDAAPGAVLSRLTDDVACVQGLVSAQTVGLLTDLGTAAVVGGWRRGHSPRA